MDFLKHLDAISFHFILQLYCPIGISPMGNLGHFPWGKPAATESHYPSYGACQVFQCFHNPTNSDLDYRIFNVRTDVNACSCTWRCTETVRESALKGDSGRKIPCHIGESNLCQRCAGWMLHQRSYISTPDLELNCILACLGLALTYQVTYALCMVTFCYIRIT